MEYEEKIAERVRAFFPGAVVWLRGSRVYINTSEELKGALNYPARAIDNYAGGINHEIAHQIAALLEGKAYQPEPKQPLRYDDVISLDGPDNANTTL